MPIKVSVVIPVYNPGTYIEDCIASLLRQSMPDDEYEAIFVNDGSTDGTPQRLDRLAAEHPHMRVIHQEGSGWSGKPRNVGVAAAKGEFIQFVDNDDWLGDDALERMYNYGVENNADVIVGKMAGKGRPVPRELFRENRPHANVENAPLIDSLTPHKMFRKAFLDKHNLRYMEGRRRLEDHVFVTEAYLRAENVAVLSDYLCYYHVKREDASNAGFQRFDPVGYFKNLREALDVVEKLTEPGPLRDRLFRRWLRVEMVERMRGQRLLKLPVDYRRELFDEMHKVVVERFGPGVAAGMQPTQQIVAGLIAADRLADIEEFAKWESGIKPSGVLENLGWENGKLTIGFTAEYTSAGVPVTFRADGEKDLLVPSLPETSLDAIALLDVNISAALAGSKVDLVVSERATAAEFFQPVEFTRERVAVEGREGHFRQVLRATAQVDPLSAANGAALDRGIWDVHIRITSCGWSKGVRLGSVRGDGAGRGLGAAVVGSPAHSVLPYWTDPHGNLSLDVDQKTNKISYEFAGLTAADVSVTTGPDSLTVALPFHVQGECMVGLKLTNVATSRAVDLPATLTARGTGRAELSAGLPLGELVDGQWRLGLILPSTGAGKPVDLPWALDVSASGGAVVKRLAASAKAPGSRGLASRLVKSTFLRRAAGRLRRALKK
ncbi:glycosyltransferase [Streptomyces sp. NBC_00201]|uniref:glycosyltransferase n=1 Tax=unclassified Streptomyces TaxID=2593676 RepID=UPI00225301D2|nr:MULTISPECIES: glycosyltransferase [unclassified Streptomyces]MCX5052581.1 glycosyltransferase [Streptomyces sp. NBC_00474]MCX5062400.1 glycosyltransferase [Streptomyces sp. NBC_00452]MCX5250026.1 glycosyltransferase [Streptomyces sp. NBC_00201]MCX5291992.1 glycosyltransferase [Streptomyces sp. NBC_00183]